MSNDQAVTQIVNDVLRPLFIKANPSIGERPAFPEEMSLQLYDGLNCLLNSFPQVQTHIKTKDKQALAATLLKAKDPAQKWTIEPMAIVRTKLAESPLMSLDDFHFEPQDEALIWDALDLLLSFFFIVNGQH